MNPKEYTDADWMELGEDPFRSDEDEYDPCEHCGERNPQRVVSYHDGFNEVYENRCTACDKKS